MVRLGGAARDAIDRATIELDLLAAAFRLTGGGLHRRDRHLGAAGFVSYARAVRRQLLHARWPTRRFHQRHDVHWLVRVKPRKVVAHHTARDHGAARFPARLRRPAV